MDKNGQKRPMIEFSEDVLQNVLGVIGGPVYAPIATGSGTWFPGGNKSSAVGALVRWVFPRFAA